MTKSYQWTLTFREDAQGFQKTIEVESASYGLAVTLGLDKLSERYDVQKFELIQLTRKGSGS